MFVDLTGLAPGGPMWALGAFVDFAITMGLPLMVGGIVGPLAALWYDRD